jgi:hypothetical protein
MKHILTLTLTFVIGIFISKAQSIEQCQRIIDSLSKKYNKKIIGYQKSITINPVPRETFIYYYIDKNGEIQDDQAWAQILKNEGKLKETQPHPLHDHLPYAATAVYYNNNYIGYIKEGYFTKVTNYDPQIYSVMFKEIKDFLNTKEKLDNYLLSIFGKYYIKTTN